ncbi:response regulator transcription factor [Arthrobacter sp. lap29]|uniref:response regulator transcription factor n=1 Tax=Arthrobacter sp. lap29 TaxID=3056122 RepID=UPI0028F72AA2|nr:response regulator transcription factor [Arthrobacter sp. lap29]
MTIRVLVVDDQAMVREGFAALLGAQDDIAVVGQAENGAIAVEMAAIHRPDVVLMDVRMPVMDGLEAARRILADASPARLGDPAAAGPGPDGTDISSAPAGVTHVLMLTTFDVDDYVYDALRLGASGFLLKDALAEELVAAVRIVASGEALLAPSVTKRLIEQFALSRARPQLSRERLDGLTERELEVMTLLGRGWSNQEIAAELFIAQQTVKTHVSKILAKLELRDRVQAVVLAYDTGLVQPGS